MNSDIMWLCRSRSHQWPTREHAEACCHTHQLEIRHGHGPRSHPGPEPVLPFNGQDEPAAIAYCWVLMEAARVTKPMLIQPPALERRTFTEAELGPLGP